MKSPYASFTRRALARLIDLLVVLTPCGILYFINRALGFPIRYTSLFNYRRPESATMFMTEDFAGFFSIFITIKLLIAYPYFALLESSAWQATLGKLALGIKVTDTDGNRISFGRATGRYFLKSFSATLCMLGYLVSFSDRRQTFHDFMSRTLVLRKEVFPQYYVMPRSPSRWMFTVPLVSARTTADEVPASTYECIWCNHRGERHVGCPRCGRPSYASVGVIKAMLLINALIFTALGVFLAYLTWVIANQRLLDDRLGREGAPWGAIFVVFLGSALCLGAGVPAFFGKKWILQATLVLIGSGRRGG
ncbi:MAG TPA: RDD family protein [Pyrinomonadaceae bacterium]|nr:RDD family protein [Pyrinomonadaceae bacterium]